MSVSKMSFIAFELDSDTNAVDPSPMTVDVMHEDSVTGENCSPPVLKRDNSDLLEPPMIKRQCAFSRSTRMRMIDFEPPPFDLDA